MTLVPAERILSTYRRLHSERKTAEELGISRNAVRWHLSKVKDQAPSSSREKQSPPPDNADQGKIELLQVTISDLRSRLKTALREGAESDQIRKEIFGLSNTPVDVPDWVTENNPATGGPGVPITLWSDWHWGEVVKAEEVSGVNCYNLEIAHQRAKLLVD